MFNLKTH